MKKTKTIKKNYEFKNILNKGKYSAGDNIECYYLKNNKNINLIGIAISSKAAKAIERNRIKRIIRENYKEEEKDLKTGYTMVFLWKKKVDTKDCSFYNIQKDIKKIFKDIGIYIDS